MRDLYQINFPDPGDGTNLSDEEYLELQELWRHLRKSERIGVLVKVERCEHGFIDPHDTEYNPIKDRALDGHRCPGAELENN